MWRPDGGDRVASARRKIKRTALSGGVRCSLRSGRPRALPSAFAGAPGTPLRYHSALPPMRSPATHDTATALVGGSAALRKVRRTIGQVAASDASVLILGETGTGKELVARLLHASSRRAAGPFVPVNCAAIPEHLLESEMFGHEKGAFTGAIGRRAGRFERANGGTIFLDEVGDMSHPLQAKILRVLQEREIERVGAVAATGVDVRVVSATHRNLESAIEAGEFRRDLFYRLAVVDVELPPLRERMDDLDPLIAHFAGIFADKHRRVVKEISDSFLAHLRRYRWPGNVRELANAIERAVVVSESGVLRPKHLPDRVRGTTRATAPESAKFPSLATVEREHLERALQEAGGNQSEAARLLGIRRQTLRRKMQKYGIPFG